jgi:hypothetical protein
VGLKSPQVFLVRTDLLDACKKENEKDIYKICDENGFGLMRVTHFDNGTVLLKRQSILYSKLDTTEWCWLQSKWFENGKKNGFCLATMVAASIHGLAPANPIKDPCIAIYKTNEEQKMCCIQISINGTLRSGKCYQVDNGKTRIETNVTELVEYYDKHGHYNIKEKEDLFSHLVVVQVASSDIPAPVCPSCLFALCSSTAPLNLKWFPITSLYLKVMGGCPASPAVLYDVF